MRLAVKPTQKSLAQQGFSYFFLPESSLHDGKDGTVATECPRLLSTLLIGDDAGLLAQASCLLAQPGAYLPIFDGPRMTRDDWSNEAIRRNNAAALFQPKQIALVSLGEAATRAMREQLPASRTKVVTSTDDLRSLSDIRKARTHSAALQWGNDKLGLGLLQALRSGRTMSFSDETSPSENVPSVSGHLVVCEDGNELSQVIAANYAYSIGAGLCLIPKISSQESDEILEEFYSAIEQRDEAASSVLTRLKERMRTIAGDIPLANAECVTFITHGLPWGFAYSEVPSTHLFIYPDLGVSILNGVAAEQKGKAGIRVAAVVDPGQVKSEEVQPVIRSLTDRSVFTRGTFGPSATVDHMSKLSDHFPFDFLLISTHCGDAPGWRWTYEFADSQGEQRQLVVDITIGIGIVPGEDLLDVQQFMRFVSMDGVDWYDPLKSQKLKVGTAIHDFIRLTNDPINGLEPISKVGIDRVIGSAAIKMADGNYLRAPKSLACGGAPIVLNNACGSWHQLARTYTFSNARAYIGTLHSVNSMEAASVVTRLFEKYFGQELAIALWRTQKEVYGETDIRRPYVLVGPHFQRLRSTKIDASTYVLERLTREFKNYERMATQPENSNESRQRTIKNILDFIDNTGHAVLQHKEQRTLRQRGKP